MKRIRTATAGAIAGGLPPFIAGEVMHYPAGVVATVMITALACLFTGVIIGAMS